MVIITIDGAYVGYDATSDVTIVTTVSGADVAWQEAVAGVVLAGWYYRTLLQGGRA